MEDIYLSCIIGYILSLKSGSTLRMTFQLFTPHYFEKSTTKVGQNISIMTLKLIFSIVSQYSIVRDFYLKRIKWASYHLKEKKGVKSYFEAPLLKNINTTTQGGKI